MARPRTTGRMGSRESLEDAVRRLMGRSQREIAAELGVGQRTVGRVLLRIAAGEPKPGADPEPASEPQLAEPQLAASELIIPPEPKPCVRPEPAPESIPEPAPDWHQHIAALRGGGLTRKMLADQLGVSFHTLRDWRRRRSRPGRLRRAILAEMAATRSGTPAPVEVVPSAPVGRRLAAALALVLDHLGEVPADARRALVAALQKIDRAEAGSGR